MLLFVGVSTFASQQNLRTMKRITYLMAIVFFYHSQTTAQSFDSLTRYNDSNVYYSTGHETWAAGIHNDIGKALDYFAAELKFKPSVTVLVLNEQDWSKFTSMPVYGMPHYNDSKTLIVAATDNPMWQAFLPDLKLLPEELARKVKETYTREDGRVTMEGFFDLLALHELGHAFHLQGGLDVQRKWMGELFCNLFLHTYVAENVPEKIAALTVFPEMVVGAGDREFVFKTLKQFEENYRTIAQKYPKNYGWYQCRLHLAAGKIYDARGKEAFLRLWKALGSEKKIDDDKQFADVLQKEVDQSVSNVMLKW